jgi:hypothetical protein
MRAFAGVDRRDRPRLGEGADLGPKIAAPGWIAFAYRLAGASGASGFFDPCRERKKPPVLGRHQPPGIRASELSLNSPLSDHPSSGTTASEDPERNSKGYPSEPSHSGPLGDTTLTLVTAPVLAVGYEQYWAIQLSGRGFSAGERAVGGSSDVLIGADSALIPLGGGRKSGNSSTLAHPGGRRAPCAWRSPGLVGW